MRLILSLSFVCVAACGASPAGSPLFPPAEFAQCRAVAWHSTRTTAVPELGLTHDLPAQAYERRQRLEEALQAWNSTQSREYAQAMARFEQSGSWDREWEATVRLQRSDREQLFADCERRLGLN